MLDRPRAKLPNSVVPTVNNHNRSQLPVFRERCIHTDEQFFYPLTKSATELIKTPA